MQPLGNAANAVAAHFALAAIGVEHTHSGVGCGGLGCANADNAVCSHRKVAAGKLPGPFGDLQGQAGFAAVQINIIVGTALHFGKSQFHGVSLLSLWRKPFCFFPGDPMRARPCGGSALRIGGTALIYIPYILYRFSLLCTRRIWRAACTPQKSTKLCNRVLTESPRWAI